MGSPAQCKSVAYTPVAVSYRFLPWYWPGRKRENIDLLPVQVYDVKIRRLMLLKIALHTYKVNLLP
jgi:hypothetical protein